MNQATRYDTEKNMLDLVPVSLIEEVGKVLTFGAKKYDRNNWQKGMSWSRCISSLKRHLAEFEKGNEYDIESGLDHLGHCATNIAFLIEYRKLHPEMDDRNHWYKKPFKRLFLDLDGVLCDFEQYFLKYFDLPNYHPHDWADDRFTTRLEELKDNDEFWLNAPVLTKPEDISYPITGYCTARSVKPEVILKWLSLNKFPKAQLLQVEFGESKVEKLKEAKCDIMLDDSIHNFVELNSNGIVCYLMTRSHNEKYNAGYLRVKDFKDFLTKI